MYFTIAAASIYVVGEYFYKPYKKYIPKPLYSPIPITPETTLGALSSILKVVSKEAYEQFLAFKEGNEGVFSLEFLDTQLNKYISYKTQADFAKILLSEGHNIRSCGVSYIEYKDILDSFKAGENNYNLKSLICDVGLRNAQEAIKSIINGDDFTEFVHPVEPIGAPLGPIMYDKNPTYDKITSILIKLLVSGVLVDASLYLKSQLLDSFLNQYLYSASSDGYEAIVTILLALGTDVNVKNDYGSTALHIASFNGHEAVVAKLLAALLTAGGDVSLKTLKGSTALYIASQNGHEAVVDKLLAAGVDVNAKNDYGSTALHIASFNGHEAVVAKLLAALLAAGGDVNAKTADGWTALYVASQKGHEAVVTKLLAVGADVESVVKKGISNTEIDLFKKAPIEYILKHQTNLSLALKGLANLEHQDIFKNLLPEIHRAESCLKAQTEQVIENLWQICGENGSFYSDHFSLEMTGE